MIGAEVLSHSLCHQASLCTNISSKLCFVPTYILFLLSGVHGTGRKDSHLNTQHEADALHV